MRKPRYPPLERGPDGKYVCRGCGGAIPPNRETWCSKKCYQEHCPQEAISIVKQRDKEVCQKCGWNYREEVKKWRGSEAAFLYRRQWWEAKPTKPEYHHVIPFSEGGSHAADNIMTLCHGCHAAETGAWRRSKSMKNSRNPKVTPAASRDIFET